MKCVLSNDTLLYFVAQYSAIKPFSMSHYFIMAMRNISNKIGIKKRTNSAVSFLSHYLLLICLIQAIKLKVPQIHSIY